VGNCFNHCNKTFKIHCWFFIC